MTELALAADPWIVMSAGSRYFGFVIGGSTPAALAADWLTSVWDQNAGLYVSGPAATVIEDVAAGWLLDLPTTASVGFATGATMANFTCLAAARPCRPAGRVVRRATAAGRRRRRAPCHDRGGPAIP